ncbi:hypothetical protein BGZ47_000192, partial [Haplosporangium gracile]
TNCGPIFQHQHRNKDPVPVRRRRDVSLLYYTPQIQNPQVRQDHKLAMEFLQSNRPARRRIREDELFFIQCFLLLVELKVQFQPPELGGLPRLLHKILQWDLEV